MKLVRRCIWCGLVMTHKNQSREHIIPLAIGGRQRVRGLLCRECNIKKGTLWDTPLIEQCRFLFSFIHGKKSEGPSPGAIVDVPGTQLRLHDDGRYTTTECEIEIIDRDGRLYLTGSAPDTKTLRNHLKHKKETDPRLSNMDIDKVVDQAKDGTTHFLGPVHAPITIGGENPGKSIVCSCLALAAQQGIDPYSCIDAMNFLFLSGKKCWNYYFTEKDPIKNRPESGILHCVTLVGDSKKKHLIGYVELFSAYRFIVLLNQNYAGEDINESYCIDITSVPPKHIRLTTDFSDAIICLPAILKGDYLHFDMLKRNLHSLIFAAKTKGGIVSLPDVLNNIVYESIVNCGAKEKGYFDQESINKSIDLFMDRVIPFITTSDRVSEKLKEFKQM